ncbi:MAG: pyroglutamyl-peptidase I [Candidatus Eremiobacteraeota bacterium]|nr:pyroglutamyl-peptidase I [Candidatus Eremiobacteraeota bacterium]
MAKHVLVTGFEPFGGEKINPSEMVVRSLEGRQIAGRAIATRVFPVETRNLHERLEKAIFEEQPDFILCLGQAGGRNAVALERVAVNVLDFEQPDNVGVMRKNDSILRGGPDARISNLPFDRILEAWKDNGVPGYVSNSAGTYLCNQALYEVLGLTESAAAPIVAGFIHFPYLPAQAVEAGAEQSPSMAFDLMKKAIENCIETVVPWVEHRSVEMVHQTKSPSSMWIPRGVKEVER